MGQQCGRDLQELQIWCQCLRQAERRQGWLIAVSAESEQVWLSERMNLLWQLPERIITLSMANVYLVRGTLGNGCMHGCCTRGCRDAFMPYLHAHTPIPGAEAPGAGERQVEALSVSG